MKAEFEEEDFEAPLYTELRFGSHRIATPGQVFEGKFEIDAALTKARFANAVRSHWAVENSLHWVLDVSMKEDECQIYRGNAAEILSGARKLALNMLRAETTRRVNVPRKQKRAYGSTDYLEKVLAAGLIALNDI